MSIKSAIEQIEDLANLTEMKRVKAHLEGDPLERNFEGGRIAFEQAIAILKEEVKE